jgi:hypothetical protein
MTPRQISMFYYPGKVGENDGPTCFLPGTNYLALDREGLGQGEERLDAQMMPPQSPEREWIIPPNSVAFCGFYPTV